MSPQKATNFLDSIGAIPAQHQWASPWCSIGSALHRADQNIKISSQGACYGPLANGSGNRNAHPLSGFLGQRLGVWPVGGLDELVSYQAGLEPFFGLTVALTLFHQRGDQALWNSFEPLARQAGVRDAVIDAIAADTAPRGLLPKEGIWAQFAIEVL